MNSVRNLGIIILIFILPTKLVFAEEWITYRDTNSGLPNNYVEHILIDTDNVKWMIDGSENLVRFDGLTWLVYNQFNSPLPFGLNNITIDKYNNKWISTDGGLVKFDGANWTTFNTGNSCVTSNIIYQSAIDTSGKIIWILTNQGVVRFDINSMACTLIDTIGGDEIIIDSKNRIWVSGGGTASLWIYDGIQWLSYPNGIHFIYPGVNIRPYNLFSDSLGNVLAAAQTWPGGYIFGILNYDTAFSVPYDTTTSINFGGTTVVYSQTNLITCYGSITNTLNYFDGSTWTFYNNGNSPIGYWNVFDIKADILGNVWLVTENGVHVFNKNLILSLDKNQYQDKFVLFPSPTSEFVFIKSFRNTEFHEAMITNVHGFFIKKLDTELLQANLSNEFLIRLFVGDIENGLYFLSFSDGNRNSSHPILIIH